jgi:hypothetical protein
MPPDRPFPASSAAPSAGYSGGSASDRWTFRSAVGYTSDVSGLL